jgi:SAM-dependent methyltransferase
LRDQSLKALPSLFVYLTKSIHRRSAQKDEPLAGQSKAAKPMKRVREEELMDVPLHAQAYAGADFSEPNTKFVAYFSAKFPAFSGRQIIDLGCGPADITRKFAARYPQASVVGTDGADAMLEIARKFLLRHGSLADRVDVRKWHIGREANPFGSKAFHAVVSNSLLHHMRDPLDLWRAIRACATPGAAVLVMDLIRPQSRREAEGIVEKYASNETDVLRGDFLNSLLAAYRPDEIMEQLSAINMKSLRVEAVSDRHLIVFGSMP